MVPRESVRGFDIRRLQVLGDQDREPSRRQSERERKNNGELKSGEIRVKDGACLKKCHVVKGDISGSSRSRAEGILHHVHSGFALLIVEEKFRRTETERRMVFRLVYVTVGDKVTGWSTCH